MKICTFNVNSIRARLQLVMSWLNRRKYDIDVMCLQEIKVTNEAFPFRDLNQREFTCEVYGQPRYNGVAICSRIPFDTVKKGFNDDFLDEQKRIMSLQIRDLTIINMYAPHGDLRGTQNYHYKLFWFTRLLKFIEENYSPMQKLMVVGDLNVTRDDLDVYDPSVVADKIGTMTEERAALQRLFGWGLIDVFRFFHPIERGFTWWDYIGGAIWRNEGMRIDYILCTEPLLKMIQAIEVDLWPRRRRSPTPSDHAPVIVTVDY